MQKPSDLYKATHLVYNSNSISFQWKFYSYFQPGSKRPQSIRKRHRCKRLIFISVSLSFQESIYYILDTLGWTTEKMDNFYFRKVKIEYIWSECTNCKLKWWPKKCKLFHLHSERRYWKLSNWGSWRPIHSGSKHAQTIIRHMSSHVKCNLDIFCRFVRTETRGKAAMFDQRNFLNCA